jgi:hypothetical protein
MHKPPIFISHASIDADISGALQALFERCLVSDRGRQLVFRSSADDAIELGTVWHDRVLAAISDAQIYLTLLTPNSIHFTPWVLYESGGAEILSRQRTKHKRRLICLSARGVQPSSIPLPLRRLQFIGIETAAGVETLLREIAVMLGLEVMSDPSVIAECVECVRSVSQTRVVANWQAVDEILASRDPRQSPFNIENALRIAHKDVLIFGQNLNYFSKSRQIHDQIADFLRGSEKRTVRVHICDDSNEQAMAEWTRLNPSNEMSPLNSYATLLRESTQRLRELGKRFEEEGIAGFSVRGYTILPFGAVVVDPALPHGTLSLHVMLNHVANANERPQFTIARRHNPELFERLWGQLENIHNVPDRIVVETTVSR